MALSSRMQYKLRQAGFVNITGLGERRNVDQSHYVGEYLTLQDVGMYPSAHIFLMDTINNAVSLTVDMFIIDEPGVWVAPEHTFTLEKMRSLTDKIRELVGYDRAMIRHYCPLEAKIKAENFFMAANPQMEWNPRRKMLAPLQP